MKNYILVLFIMLGLQTHASPLKPVKLDNPRATMQSYLAAMEDYNRGRKEHNKELLSRINDAMRTMDLDDLAPVLRAEKGKELAILLKEVIDRIIVVDVSKIPNDDSLKKRR
ncbi:MAG: hypothetical protein KDD40_02220 [Bdellovibrionales bacterium]|nr:hypothetical protein [Bdellovibrionales bacterium]